MKKAFVAALLIITAIPLLIGVAALPPHGETTAPVHTHISARYLMRGAEEAGADNIVTGVLLNYRGLDTAGEVTVIFTALVAGLAVLITRRKEPGAKADSAARGDVPAPPPVSPVVSFVVQLLAPFIALFAVYVILNGHVTPGGGFQGGAILGALFIALTIVLGEGRTRSLMPRLALPWMQGAALISFVVVGVLGAGLTGYFLGFPAEASLHLVRELMMLVLEAGIGLGGAAIFATLFLQMEAE
ncbi:MAG: sodium:proton antiporter [Coriobacteriia bacterium]|nr:sodium:proton antiporter [Coriobacteriia bacterium]